MFTSKRISTKRKSRPSLSLVFYIFSATQYITVQQKFKYQSMRYIFLLAKFPSTVQNNIFFSFVYFYLHISFYFFNNKNFLQLQSYATITVLLFTNLCLTCLSLSMIRQIKQSLQSYTLKHSIVIQFYHLRTKQ